NILGPLLVKFSREIDALVRKKLVISGILAEIYDETLAAFTALGWREAGRKTQGEWTSGLLEK
ncbi:MAG: 50S ribosomal protein L11 methyltransferase, partial [Kiritimatiellae bacterium]|nr:50S ribosomal protein L11 methyltransferase [Kiritimatiellia bacterium]